MLRSFDETKSEGTEIIVYISNDDPKLEEYKKILQGRNLIIDKRRYIVEVFNYISCELHPNIKYYGEVNDDHIYRTKGWDKVLIESIEKKGGGWGVACGQDLINNDWYKHRHPSACVISGNMVRTLGHFVLPTLRHMCTDNYLRDISEGINRLFFCPEVIVEHCHKINGRAGNDENYDWVYSKEQQDYGYAVYRKWVTDEKNIYLQKLRNIIR
jgi:hypothetical protein